MLTPEQVNNAAELQAILDNNLTIKADLNTIITGLRRKQISGSHQCAKATIEVVRSILSRYNFKSTEQLIRIVRGLGQELTAAAQSEFTIGNLIRRVLFIIREEHVSQIKETSSNSNNNNNNTNSSSSNTGSCDASVASNIKGRSNSVTSATGSMTSQDEDESVGRKLKNLSINTNTTTATADGSKNSVAVDNTLMNGIASTNLSSMWRSFNSSSSLENYDMNRFLPGLKSAVISAITELNSEIDNMTPICQRAQEYIHSGECILAYGYSKIVEQFLRAAGAKRNFQLIVAEVNNQYIDILF